MSLELLPENQPNSILDRVSDAELATIICGHCVSRASLDDASRELLTECYRRFKKAQFAHSAGQKAASVWQPFNPMADRKLLSAAEEDIEFLRTAADRTWWRRRTEDEAAELRVILKEHHPTFERLMASHPPRIQSDADAPTQDGLET